MIPILEVNDPLDCYVRELGEASIRFIVWGSLNSNPQFLVRLYGSGEMRVADMTDVRVYGNPGDKRDGKLIPPIPYGWEKQEELPF